MDFARKQLEKYGWTDGKGLGKNENGISQALKPKLKRSMTGVGHNAASDFTEHWWSTLYDKAASNIEVREKNGTTKEIKTKDGNDFEITNSSWKLKRKKSKQSDVKQQEQYEDFFVKTAVLGSGGRRTERIRESETESEEDEMQKDVFKMTDEELFAACEGRTAHKGARHGLKALGKLARIEQQEKLLLQQSRFNGYCHADRCAEDTEHKQDVMEDASLNCGEVVPVLKKKKKKKKCCLKQGIDVCLSEHSNEYFVNNIIDKKPEKNVNDADISDIFDAGNADSVDVRPDESLSRKGKKKKLNTIDKDVHGGKTKTAVASLETDVLSSKKHKKRKHLVVSDSENCDTEANLCNRKVQKKNKKKCS